MDSGTGVQVSVVLVGRDASRTAAALATPGVTLMARSTDPDEAAHVVARRRPQVAVVDLDACGADALPAIAAIAGTGAIVLAVSATAHHAQVLDAVRAGAAGYLVWTTGVAVLVDAVHRVAAGEAVFSPGLADIVLAAQERLASGTPVAARLTERELDILRLVVEGLTSRQIAARLVVSPRTVENHVHHLLTKLEQPNRATLVRYAIEQGLA